MKARAALTIIFILCAAASFAGVMVGVSHAGANPRVPVLVELFTSEGCSSCPPADALLARFDMQQPFANAEVIVLEQHVDYWDDQGWKDPFASASATRRQEDYAKSLGGEVYTPQMVVDGREEFVGSDPSAARRAIESATGTAKAAIQLSWAGDTPGDSRTLRVRAGKLASGDSGGADVILAVTESRLHSDVRRGENAGRGLEHDGVVREFVRLGRTTTNAETSFDSQTPAKLARDWKRENLRAVVFIQAANSGRILAVAAIAY